MAGGTSRREPTPTGLADRRARAGRLVTAQVMLIAAIIGLLVGIVAGFISLACDRSIRRRGSGATRSKENL